LIDSHDRNPQVSTEISLQPWRAYKTDGVILFSDILTPLPGMGVEFTIEEKQGPKITPIRTWEQVRSVLGAPLCIDVGGADLPNEPPCDHTNQPQVKQMHLMDPMATCPFVDQTLRDLRREVRYVFLVEGLMS